MCDWGVGHVDAMVGGGGQGVGNERIDSFAERARRNMGARDPDHTKACFNIGIVIKAGFTSGCQSGSWL